MATSTLSALTGTPYGLSSLWLDSAPKAFDPDRNSKSKETPGTCVAHLRQYIPVQDTESYIIFFKLSAYLNHF